MKFIKLVKASEDWEVEKINENDWVIKSPDGTYKNSNGKDYHFKTKEDALEELDYLRAEHKFDKKSSKKIKSGESYGWYVDSSDAWDKLQLWIDTVGAEAALDDIAHAMGTDELSECLAFIFRNNDFKEGCSDYEEEVDE